MKDPYKRNELAFALSVIVLYCFLFSCADTLSAMAGMEYSFSAIFGILLSMFLLAYIRRSKLLEYYGLCLPSVNARSFLYYIPLLILSTGNAWNGFSFRHPPFEMVCAVVSMLCIGFLEEVIFRGLLLKILARNNIKVAVIVSSVTFGIGHIINLFNGSGMDAVDNLLQIIFAISAGFLFAVIFLCSGSILPCIAAHALINILDIFSDKKISVARQVTILSIMIAVAAAYTAVIIRARTGLEGNQAEDLS